jgi:DNA-binding response OmpR family regulator
MTKSLSETLQTVIFMNDPKGRAAAGKRKILIVDDASSVADFIREMLRSFGHEADVSLSVSQALSLFEAVNYDLVITDYTMPGMNGVDFARRLKERNPSQLIMLITGSTFSLTGGGDSPVDAVLQKPFSILEFQALLTKMFTSQNPALPAHDHQGHQASSNHQGHAQGGVRSLDGRAQA